MDPIHSHVGTIVDGDNRFFGRSVADDWSRQWTAASDALLIALGVGELTAHAREVVRLMTLGLTSPDARIWPLKLTRLLASHGDPVAGYFGGQLMCAGKVMGPGAGVQAARALVWIAEEVGDDPSDADVARATAAWRARAGGRVGGFGVPFRAVDERRTLVLRLAAGGPIARGRYWRLHEQVVAAMLPQRPNCVITFAAMLLDIGVAAERVGLAIAVGLSHVFLAHAIEAAAGDGARAYDLPRAAIDYRGAAPRDSRTAVAVVPPAALRRDLGRGEAPQ